MRRASLVVVAALGLVVVAQAGAHAEITPKKVPAGGVSTFVLAVEGEESAPTVKVAMQLPPGMANLKPATVPRLAGEPRRTRHHLDRWTHPAGQDRRVRDHGAVPQDARQDAEVPGRSDLRQRDGRPLDRRAVVADARSHDPAHGGGRATATSAATSGGHHSHDSHDALRARTTTTTGRPAGSSGLPSSSA